jgi:uncharacterized protein YndB with AHSA1/START domain
MNHSFKINRLIKAPLEKVFTALTNQEELAEYTGDCIIELKKGGKLEMFDGWVKGEVKEFEPNKKFVYTWKASEWDEATPASLVVYTFSSKGNDTEVVLEHTNLPTDKEAKSHEEGWEDFVFGPLEDYLGV